MTYIEQAIKEAEKEGFADISAHASQEDLQWLLAIISPSFWQALGKARGWPPYSPTGYVDNYENDLEDLPELGHGAGRVQRSDSKPGTFTPKQKSVFMSSNV
jgi:hypothetical protein